MTPKYAVCHARHQTSDESKLNGKVNLRWPRAYIPRKILMEDNGTASGTQKFQMSETFCASVNRNPGLSAPGRR